MTGGPTAGGWEVNTGTKKNYGVCVERDKGGERYYSRNREDWRTEQLPYPHQKTVKKWLVF